LKPLLEASAAEIEQSAPFPITCSTRCTSADVPHGDARSVGGGGARPPQPMRRWSRQSPRATPASPGALPRQPAPPWHALYRAARRAGDLRDPRAVFTFGYTRGEPPCLAVPVEGGGGSTESGPSAAATGLRRGSEGIGRLCTRTARSSSIPTAPGGAHHDLSALRARVDNASWDVMGLCGTGSDTYSVSDLFCAQRIQRHPPRHRPRSTTCPRVRWRSPSRSGGERHTLPPLPMQLVASSGLSSVAIEPPRHA